MSNGSIIVFLAATLLAVPAIGSAADAVGAATKTAATSAGVKPNPWREKYTQLRKELKEIGENLDRSRAELAKLRHRWMVQKGRLPTKKEIKEYEKKLAEGKAKPGDNPFVNRNPLSSPARARLEYYAKLDEVHKKEEHQRNLTDELSALDRKADEAGIPADQRIESPSDERK